MKQAKKIDDKLIVLAAVVVSLVFTPVNFDALIIPKVIIMFCSALYLLPKIYGFFLSTKLNSKINLTLLIIMVGALVHLLTIIFISNAPFEQQLWGRTGRGFGLITYFSFLVFLFVSIITYHRKNLSLIINGIAFSSLISGFYSILQRHSLDIFAWDSKTNGIIGTIGNPNFQASFAAAGFIGIITVASRYKLKLLYYALGALYSGYLIYICQATQGYIGILAAGLTFIAIWAWFKSRLLLGVLLVVGLAGTLFAILGMLNRGPLAYYLYKISVQSRGDFFRSAFTTANDHPIFGVGLDSFGDYYLRNRDYVAANHSFAELTDNAHNYFLEFAATGGYPFALLYFGLILLSFILLINLVKNSQYFDKNLAAIFSIWIVFQIQSLVSPGSITIMLWNFIACGAVIGCHLTEKYKLNSENKSTIASTFTIGRVLLLIIGLSISFPYFNTDRLIRIGLDQRNGNILIEQVNSYPRFVNKYRLVGTALLDSSLSEQSLLVARNAVKFNPEDISGWALIFFNPVTDRAERDAAKLQVQRLDPWNKEVLSFKY